MKKKSKISVIILITLFTLTSGAAGSYYFIRNKLDKNIALNTPPSIYVNSPSDGDGVPVDQPFLVEVTASGEIPLERIEIWIDGSLVDSYSNTSGENVYIMNVEFRPQVTKGLHILSARAINISGLIEQTGPIALLGDESGQSITNPAYGDNENLLPGEGSNVSNAPPSGGGQAPPPVHQIPHDSPPPPPMPIIPPGTPRFELIKMDEIVNIGGIMEKISANKPPAPDQLFGGVDGCKIRLSWQDRSINETHFNVWMQPLGAPARVIATLKGSSYYGLAYFDFDAPGFGIFSFWIEAANAMGGQPSEIIWLGVRDTQCQPGVSTHLELEATDMQVFSAYDRAYCYLSVEGFPAERVPANDDFIMFYGFTGDLTKWMGGTNKKLIPLPMDGEVSLAGECMGWMGGTLHKLGKFNISVPKEKWTGEKLEIKGDQFVIYFNIKPRGTLQASGFYFYTDPTILTPYGISSTRHFSLDPGKNFELDHKLEINWQWDGKPADITGFTVYMIDKVVGRANPNDRDVEIYLPTSCGGVYEFKVAANSSEAQSSFSEIYLYNQNKCRWYAEVEFTSLTIGDIQDGIQPGSCDTAEVTYLFSVEGVDVDGRWFGYMDHREVDISCGVWLLDLLPLELSDAKRYDNQNTLYVAFDPQYPFINLIFSMMDHDDTGNRSDLICFVETDILVELKDGQSYQLEFTCNRNIPTWYKYGEISADGSLQVIVRVYKGQYK